MKLCINLFLLMVPASLFSQYSQQSFAVVSSAGKKADWVELHQTDLHSGKTITQLPTPKLGLLAACGFDQVSGRLYFAPMYQNRLYFLEPGNPKTGNLLVEGPELVPGADMKEIPNQVTRMTVDARGSGYALTNDARHLVRFSTRGGWQVQDLGPLSDAPENGDMSVFNPCTSWGGDMVADIYGNLFLVTGNRAVYHINVRTRQARFKGVVRGLPANFTTNGVMADEQGRLVVGSAVSGEGFFRVDHETLEATSLQPGQQSSRVADLASPHVLFQAAMQWEKKTVQPESSRPDITIYPNPVSNGRFQVSFSRLPRGKYELAIFDWNGKLLQLETRWIGFEKQVEELQLKRMVSNGVYLLKITGREGRIYYSDKLVVQ